jgi:DNA repair exonuclease SbcCD nuclease subunit
MPFRFVHTADIHLDSPLRSLALRDAALGELIGTATRQAFTAVIDLCLEERVDALLIAGDLYDGEQTSMKTALFLAAQLHRLHLAGIRGYLIRGNHDAESRITRELTLPDSVTLFDGRGKAEPMPRDDASLPVVIHGISFRERQAPESLLPRYRPPVEGAVNIGLMHTSLDGAAGHDNYAPCRLADLLDHGFSYWALGHIHRRAVHGDARHCVVMPGMPQGRDINEAGAKSASLVTIGDDFSITISEHITSVAQFERVRLDLTGIDDWGTALRRMGTELEAARDQAASRHLIARLELVGATPLAWRMRRDRDVLLGEAQNLAQRLRDCAIEQIVPECRTPAAPGSDLPVEELGRLIESTVLPDAGFELDLARLVEGLRLPHETRVGLFGDQPPSAAFLADLAREGTADVLARLQGSGSV